VLSDLQERGVVRGLDEIPGRIDLKQTHLTASTLSGKNYGRVSSSPLRLDTRTVSRLNLVHRLPDKLRRPIQRLAGHHALYIGIDKAAFHSRFDLSDNALSDAQIARSHEGYDALARILKDKHLPKATDVVDPRIRSRIGQQNQTSLEFETNAICHDFDRLLLCLRLRDMNVRHERLVALANKVPTNWRSVISIKSDTETNISIGRTQTICRVKPDPSQITRISLRPSVRRSRIII
jgi:hypothetical protein